MHTKTLDVWVDVMCPWCLIGIRRLQLVEGDPLLPDVVWRSHELRPDAPRERTESLRSVMIEKRGLSPEQTTAVFSKIEGQIRDLGSRANLDGVYPVNSLDALRLIKFATDRMESPTPIILDLFDAHLWKNQNVSDPNVLVSVGSRFGLDPVDVHELIESDRYVNDVRRDEAFGVTTVPTYKRSDGNQAVGALSISDLRSFVLT